MKHSLILLMSILTLNLQAQSSPNQPVQDPGAEIYLDKLAEIFTGQEAVQMEFKYEVISRIENTKVSDFGSIIIKGEKYKMKTEDTEVYFNGVNLWTYSVNVDEVYLSEPDPESMDQTLANPFLLIGNYKDYYKYKLKNETTAEGRKYAVVELYPKDPDVEYSILRILINKTSLLPYSFTMQQKNGFDFNIIINEFIQNVKIGDATFEWDSLAHPDVMVIEM